MPRKPVYPEHVRREVDRLTRNTIYKTGVFEGKRTNVERIVSQAMLDLHELGVDLKNLTKFLIRYKKDHKGKPVDSTTFFEQLFKDPRISEYVTEKKLEAARAHLETIHYWIERRLTIDENKKKYGRAQRTTRILDAQYRETTRAPKNRGHRR